MMIILAESGRKRADSSFIKMTIGAPVKGRAKKLVFRLLYRPKDGR